MAKQKLTDLEKFHQLFYCDKFKAMKDGIEYRCNNIDRFRQDARKLIEQHKLKLIAVTEGNMASRGAFMVKPL